MSSCIYNLNVDVSEANRRQIYVHTHTYIYKTWGQNLRSLDIARFALLQKPGQFRLKKRRIKIYLPLAGFTLKDWVLSRCFAVVFLRKVMTSPWYPLQKTPELRCQLMRQSCRCPTCRFQLLQCLQKFTEQHQLKSKPKQLNICHPKILLCNHRCRQLGLNPSNFCCQNNLGNS